MGWFDGWFGSGSRDSDPLRRLDPKLREFLERESPIKYTTTTTSNSAGALGDDKQKPQQEQQAQQQAQQQPVVPAESLFPDGRYAHLWKTYRPLAAVEAETKSDHEKLTDVLEAYKERRAAIGRAALENCAEEQAAWSACMKGGGWTARLTLCRDEVQRFERCYTGQSRLLKALGYLSVYGRGADVDEEIQMRADALYHRMLAQEREIERARAEGREPPAFAPLLDNVAPPAAADTAAAAATAAAAVPTAGAAGAKGGVPEPSPATLKAWKERLEKLPPEEREAEEQALRAEHRAKAEMAAQIQGVWEEQAKAREARKREGKETLLDKWTSFVSALSGPRSS